MTDMKYLLFILLLVAILITAGCIAQNNNANVPPTPQIVYVTVLVTPTQAAYPTSTSQIIHFPSLLGAFIDVKTHTACLDFSSDGTYIISNIKSNTGYPSTYQIKNNQILLSVPVNSMIGVGSNNIVVTCNLNGNIIDCGEKWGTFQKAGSCNSFANG
jgi:hypothetical protein